MTERLVLWAAALFGACLFYVFVLLIFSLEI